MAFSSTFLLLVRRDVALFGRFPRLRWLVLGSLLVPTLYTIIYLASLWDPSSHTADMPVGLYSADQGFDYRGQHVALGEQIIVSLMQERRFNYRRYGSEQEVRQAVIEGKLLFAVLVPRDFSALAVPGDHQGSARINVYTSEGNHYAGAAFAKRFAPELASHVNESLNEQRWATVLNTAVESQDKLELLKQGVALLQDGAQRMRDGSALARGHVQKLHDGLKQAQGGSQALAQGAEQLAEQTPKLQRGLHDLQAGLVQMQQKFPDEQQIGQFRLTSSHLRTGQNTLSAGLAQIHGGAITLERQTEAYRNHVADMPFVGGGLTHEMAPFETALHELVTGVDQAYQGSRKLEQGQGDFDRMIGQLAQDMTQMGSGLRQLAAAAPNDGDVSHFARGVQQVATGGQELQGGMSRLVTGAESLQQGVDQLSDGASHLAFGVEQLVRNLPEAFSTPDGTATGLAGSVQADIEVTAPVENNGLAFAPSFAPLALWIGATIATFVFAVRKIPQSAAMGMGLAKIAGKMVAPTVLTWGQVFVMFLAALLFLPSHLPHPWLVLLTLMVTSWAFVAMLMAMVCLFGETGKALALLLLIVQLSAAGATLPIELTSPFFQAIHPFIPFTWVVRAMRAAMFDAFGPRAWMQAILVILLAGAVAIALTRLLGRWKIVSDDVYAPGVELD